MEKIMNNDNLTRRNFVKSSIVAAGSAALLPAQSPNDTVRVAFIGVGNRGSYVLKHMLKVPGEHILEAEFSVARIVGDVADVYRRGLGG